MRHLAASIVARRRLCRSMPASVGSPGAALSSGNTSNQLEDATMRSQFNKQGTGYHVLLSPVVHDPVTIVVPSGRGTLLQTRRGVPGRSRDSQRVRRQPEYAVGSLAARVSRPDGAASGTRVTTWGARGSGRGTAGGSPAC